MVERGGLENRCASDSTEGSNPSLSSILKGAAATQPLLSLRRAAYLAWLVPLPQTCSRLIFSISFSRAAFIFSLRPCILWMLRAWVAGDALPMLAARSAAASSVSSDADAVGACAGAASQKL